jgi:hypothetical protein
MELIKKGLKPQQQMQVDLLNPKTLADTIEKLLMWMIQYGHPDKHNFGTAIVIIQQ